MKKLVAVAFLLAAAMLLSNGDVWSAWLVKEMRISFDEGDSAAPAVAASGNAVYVVWSGSDPENENRTIKLDRSFNGGKSFSGSPMLISDGRGTATDPDIAVNGSNVYIVWSEDDVPGSEGNPDICFAVSNNGGNTLYNRFKKGAKDPCTLVTSLNLSASPTPDSICPSIAVHGSNVYVAWSEFSGTTTGGGTFQVVLAQSTNGGRAFGKGKVVSTPLSGQKDDALCPDLAVSGSIVYAVWMDDSYGNFEIAFKQLTGRCLMVQERRGAQQQGCPAINLSNSARDSIDPVIAVHGRNIYVAWADKSDGDYDIYFTASHDGGVTFSRPQNVSDDESDSLSPALATQGSRVYLSWVTFDLDSTLGQGMVTLSRSINSGRTFEDELYTSQRTNAQSPALAASNSKLFLAWVDDLNDEDCLGPLPCEVGTSSVFFNFSDASGFAPIGLRESGSIGLLSAPHYRDGHLLASARGAQRLRLELFSLAGGLLLAAESASNSLFVPAVDRRGQALANGVYLYRATLLDEAGRVLGQEVRKLVVVR